MALIHKPVLLILWISHVKIRLINIVIFCSNIKLIWLFFREFHGVYTDQGLLIILSVGWTTWLIEHIEINLWIIQLTKMPLADLAVVGNTNNIVCILCTNDSKRINWMWVTIFCYDTLLNCSWFSTDVPLNDVSWLSCTNNNIWLKWTKHCFCDLILASKRVLRSIFQTEWKDIYQTVRLIIS